MANTLLLIAFYLALLLIPILLGVPVVYSIGITSILLLVLPIGPVFELSQVMNLVIIRMFRGSMNFILVALPLYLFAGRLLINGGSVDRLFEFAEAIVAPVQGGMGQVNVLASILFSGISGSALADAAGLGLVEYEMMTEAGYDEEFAVAVTGASSVIGPIFPPSIPLILYGALAEVSIGLLFLGGVIPGLLMAAMLFIAIYVLTRMQGHEPVGAWQPRTIASTLARALPALFTIIIIVFGLFLGLFTATEAGAAAAVWAFFVGTIVYGDLDRGSFYDAARETMIDTSALLIILSSAMAYAFVIVSSGIPSVLAEALLELTLGPTAILFLIVAILLLIGMVLGPLTVLILFLPVLAPNFAALGIDPLHFGIVMILTLMIGLLTPPVGAILFVLEEITGVSLLRISKAMVPFYVPLLVALVLIILLPDLVTYIPLNYGP